MATLIMMGILGRSWKNSGTRMSLHNRNKSHKGDPKRSVQGMAATTSKLHAIQCQD